MNSTSLGATLATCSEAELLVPGSVGALRGDAEQLDQQAHVLAQQAEELREAHPATWTGAAADGWAARREQFAQTLDTVSQIHATSASTLLLHAETLAWGQGRAETAIRLYAHGCTLRDAELGPSGALLAGQARSAPDAGSGYRSLAEDVLAVARDEVVASARAAAAVLDELSAGLPDGRWHLGDFAQGMWSWVTGIVGVLWKFNSLRGLIDPGGTLRDGTHMLGGGIDAYESLIADPIGTSEQLAQLDLLRDRPAQWWGQLAPDIALAAAGGVGATTRALRGFSFADGMASVGDRLLPGGLRLGVPDPTHRPFGASWGTSFFSEDVLQYYTGVDTRLGNGKSPMFHMTFEDAMHLTTPDDVLRHTGYAPSVEDAIRNPGPEGPEIYGVAFPREGLSPRVPVAEDAGGFPHYLEGGHTAVRLDDAPGRPGTGGYLVNSTREYVLDGAPPMPGGGVLFQLGPDGTWLPMRRFP